MHPAICAAGASACSECSPVSHPDRITNSQETESSAGVPGPCPPRNTNGKQNGAVPPLIKPQCSLIGQDWHPHMYLIHLCLVAMIPMPWAVWKRIWVTIKLSKIVIAGFTPGHWLFHQSPGMWHVTRTHLVLTSLELISWYQVNGKGIQICMDKEVHGFRQTYMENKIWASFVKI